MKITYDNVKVLILTCIILFILMIIINNLIEKPEGFENKEYLKFNETYLDSKKLKLDLLYANYNGDEIGQESWTNKTLDQCIDTCNKLDNCIGFSRPIVDDKEYSKCFPKTNLDQCYSNRKGDFNQRQHALGYNTYIKSNIDNSLTKCLGDSKLTLGRTIFIKSHAYPTQYLGVSKEGELCLLHLDENIQTYFSWKIIAGLDGSGTISIKHNQTNKLLYRDSNDKIIIKDVNQNSKTIDKQRSSFYLLDGLSNNTIFECLQLDLETNTKYISIYSKNPKYLTVVSNDNIENNKNIKKLKNTKMMTFEIIDNIINSKIINNVPNEYPIKTYPATPNQIVATPNGEIQQNYDKFTDIVNPTQPLDISTNNFAYYNLFSGKNTDRNLTNYLTDNYSTIPDDIKKLETDDFLLKFNNMKTTDNLNSILNNNKSYYNGIKKTNMTLEDMIIDKNKDVTKKSQLLVNKLNNMKLQDESSDYFFLKNLVNN